MTNGLGNEQLRAISPFFVKDTDVLLLSEGQLKRTKLTQSSEQHAAFAKIATEWEKGNCPLLTGSNEWTAIIDDAEVIIAYCATVNNTGLFHLWIRDVNGEAIVHEIVGEKPLEPDPIGNFLAATVVTLGAALIVRAIAAGIASNAAAAGARIVSLAVARVVAGETTEGVVLTALRSIRAQAMVKALRARGAQVIVNIGGEAGVEELSQFGVDQIALNHQVRMGIARRFVPNLVKENGDRIGEVFGPNTIDKIVSRKLDSAFFEPSKLARGAFNVLKVGGRLEMQIFPNNPAFRMTFTTALRNARFRDVKDIGGVFFTAVK